MEDLKIIADQVTKIGENVEAAKTEIKANTEKEVKAIASQMLEVEEKSMAAIKVVKDELTKKFEEQEARENTRFATGPQQIKTLDVAIGEALEKAADNIEKFNRGEKKSFTIDIERSVVEQKTVGPVAVANVTGATAHWSAQGDNTIRMNQNTMTHVRSLLPTRSFGPATDYYFLRENGAGEGSIAFTAETGVTAATTQATGLKPQFDIDLVEASVKFEILAGWMLISRKALKNIPGITGFLQARLPERLLDAEDAGILYGNGTSPNIKGILASGNFTASSETGDTLAERIINDISLLEDTHKRIANGIVVRPADYYSFFLNKAEGSGEYDLPQGFQFVNGTLYILGIPVAKTTALTSGDYVVGDFRNGAELLIQEAMNIQFFEQDSTNVRTNQVTVRIEETIALPVYGDNYFVKGDSAIAS